MACRGVFFAVTSNESVALQKAAGDDERLMELVESIEEDWDEPHLAECDKAWDAMHRALTDGTLEYGNSLDPLSLCVIGPRQLHEGEDYIVSLVNPEEVKKVAKALDALRNLSTSLRQLGSFN